MVESERAHLARLHRDNYRALNALSRSAAEAAQAAGFDALGIELVKIRVSQLNGCAFCARLHIRDALTAGEQPDRIAVLSTWRETRYFSLLERAALELAEAVTLIGEGGVDDDTYRRVSAVLSEEQISAISWVASVMGVFNRLAVVSRYVVAPEPEPGERSDDTAGSPA